MSLIRKWLLVSVAAGILVTVAFFFAEDLLIGAPIEIPRPVAAVAEVVFWPVTVCLKLSGPGPPIGPPEKHGHEWTPVQDLALAVGIGLSWTFYSSLVFVALWVRRRRSATTHVVL